MNLIDMAKPAPQLAEQLARELDDATFELLVRYRIQEQFQSAHRAQPNLGESHNSCRFTFEWNDRSEWHVSVGSTYRDQVSLHGEVLAKCVENVVVQYNLQHGNKLSLLLPPPDTEE